MTDGRPEVQCCPRCGSTRIHTRSGWAPGGGWWCKGCRRAFGEPDRRPSSTSGHQRQSGLARALVEADAGEVARRG